jgi:DNA-binding MarR family transcriptional regulator
MWVKTWSQLDLPELPRSVTQPQLLVLHTLLLHAGLTTQGLAEVLPLSASEVIESIHRLRPAGLIETVGDKIQVPAMSYPVVRKALAQEGYLLDAI